MYIYNKQKLLLMSDEKFKFPTETVELPSKGLVYPEDNPLSSGVIEMKYMTAKEEDILTNQNYIKDGTVLDRLMKSLIVSKINYDDLIVGDKNAIMVASRVLGYGKDYTFTYKDEEVTVDLSSLESKYLDESKVTKGINKFAFTLPTTKAKVEFKLLSNKDEKIIKQEIKGLKKLDKTGSFDLITRLRQMILSVDGNEDKSAIREFVDTYMLARDSRALREYIKSFQPDIDLTFTFESSDGTLEEASLPVTVNFFWPDA
jgi:hypothetical protein